MKNKVINFKMFENAAIKHSLKILQVDYFEKNITIDIFCGNNSYIKWNINPDNNINFYLIGDRKVFERDNIRNYLKDMAELIKKHQPYKVDVIKKLSAKAFGARGGTWTLMP